MNIMHLGDYYAWYCEWCDTRNLTLWTRFEKNEVVCGACHKGLFTAARNHGSAGQLVAASAIL